MANLNEYSDAAIAACRSVMVEVLTILGKHREHLVIVGGWVPPLLDAFERVKALLDAVS